MNITLVSVPASVIQVSPEIISRWLATESPNNFRLQRKDWLITASGMNAGSPSDGMAFTLAEAFDGNEGDSVSVYNNFNGAMYTGLVTLVSGSDIETDIPYSASFDGAYLNDNTLFAGFYFEGQLTINDVVQALTVIATPNSFGIADIDVSGVLRITTALDKVGDYSALVMAETNKSGKFTFAYRPAWYGSDQSYIEEGNDWYYAEAVRSVEQGSNLADFVASEAGDAPFLNSFEQPVYFAGFPFDISFILPAMVEISPGSLLRVIMKRYNAAGILLATFQEDVDPATIQGRVCSLNVDPDAIEASAAYMTAEIQLI